LGFAVVPEALARYASLVERNGNSLSQANTYLNNEMKLANADGVWLQLLLPTHIETVNRMSGYLVQGAHTMGTSAEELAQAANHYRTADQAGEASLDASYPPARRPHTEAPRPVPATRHGEQGPVAAMAGDDVKDPLSFLTEPGTPGDFSDPLALFNLAGDYLSPTAMVDQVLNDTIGVNPMDVVNQLVVGDWKGFATCALVWEQLAKAADAMGNNVDNGLRWLASDWQGHAGDAAVEYFDRMGKALTSHRDTFEFLHDKYRELARDVWLASKTLADLVKLIMDKALTAAIAAAAGWALTATGAGASVSWSFAAYQYLEIIKLWGEATSVMAGVQTLITGFVALATRPDGPAFREINPIPVPLDPYNHPGVA
jgi:uncharacterized protein YukE